MILLVMASSGIPVKLHPTINSWNHVCLKTGSIIQLKEIFQHSHRWCRQCNFRLQSAWMTVARTTAARRIGIGPRVATYSSTVPYSKAREPMTGPTCTNWPPVCQLGQRPWLNPSPAIRGPSCAQQGYSTSHLHNSTFLVRQALKKNNSN